ncbi:MAG: hypothetical protein AAF585_01565 [Verrucomicrobiota bacterium]
MHDSAEKIRASFSSGIAFPLEVGDQDNRVYQVCELLPGHSIEHLIKEQGKLDASTVFELAKRLLATMQHVLDSYDLSPNLSPEQIYVWRTGGSNWSIGFADYDLKPEDSEEETGELQLVQDLSLLFYFLGSGDMQTWFYPMLNIKFEEDQHPNIAPELLYLYQRLFDSDASKRPFSITDLNRLLEFSAEKVTGKPELDEIPVDRSFLTWMPQNGSFPEPYSPNKRSSEFAQPCTFEAVDKLKDSTSLVHILPPDSMTLSKFIDDYRQSMQLAQGKESKVLTPVESVTCDPKCRVVAEKPVAAISVSTLLERKADFKREEALLLLHKIDRCLSDVESEGFTAPSLQLNDIYIKPQGAKSRRGVLAQKKFGWLSEADKFQIFVRPFHSNLFFGETPDMTALNGQTGKFGRTSAITNLFRPEYAFVTLSYTLMSAAMASEKKPMPKAMAELFRKSFSTRQSEGAKGREALLNKLGKTLEGKTLEISETPTAKPAAAAAVPAPKKAKPDPTPNTKSTVGPKPKAKAVGARPDTVSKPFVTRPPKPKRRGANPLLTAALGAVGLFVLAGAAYFLTPDRNPGANTVAVVDPDPDPNQIEIVVNPDPKPPVEVTMIDNPPVSPTPPDPPVSDPDLVQPPISPPDNDPDSVVVAVNQNPGAEPIQNPGTQVAVVDPPSTPPTPDPGTEIVGSPNTANATDLGSDTSVNPIEQDPNPAETTIGSPNTPSTPNATDSGSETSVNPADQTLNPADQTSDPAEATIGSPNAQETSDTPEPNEPPESVGSTSQDNDTTQQDPDGGSTEPNTPTEMANSNTPPEPVTPPITPVTPPTPPIVATPIFPTPIVPTPPPTLPTPPAEDEEAKLEEMNSAIGAVRDFRENGKIGQASTQLLELIENYADEPAVDAELNATISAIREKDADLEGAERDKADELVHMAALDQHQGAVSLLALWHDRSDTPTAVAWNQTAAEQGDPEAMARLGIYYSVGKHVNLDLEESVSWFEKAAQQGQVNALYYLGECYYFGKGVEADAGKAVNLLRQAHEKGEAKASGMLATLYSKGHGVEANAETARGLYEEAISRGDVGSYGNLGVLYMQGNGIDPDPSKAFGLFRRGARAGEPNSMFFYALCFESGQGTEANPENAIEWYRKAAQANQPMAIKWCEANNVDYSAETE